MCVAYSSSALRTIGSTILSAWRARSLSSVVAIARIFGSTSFRRTARSPVRFFRISVLSVNRVPSVKNDVSPSTRVHTIASVRMSIFRGVYDTPPLTSQSRFTSPSIDRGTVSLTSTFGRLMRKFQKLFVNSLTGLRVERAISVIKSVENSKFTYEETRIASVKLVWNVGREISRKSIDGVFHCLSVI